MRYFIITALVCIATFSNAQDTYNTPKEEIIQVSDWYALGDTDKSIWSIKDGVITGGDGIGLIPTNTYMCSAKSYEDFEFRCLFRITGDHDKGLINSGIQYRSIIKDGNMTGYQADIGKGYWGDIYDEHRRGKLIGGELGTLNEILNEDGWNSYIIRCVGNKHELYINGVKTSEYVERDNSIPKKGIFAIQLHSGGNAKIELKNIAIKSLSH